MHTCNQRFTACLLQPQISGNRSVLSGKLRATLKRIRENMIHFDEDNSPVPQSDLATPDGVAPATNFVAEDRRERVAHPHLSPAVDLNLPDTLYGLAERVVATESL
jgi:syndetin